MYAGTDGFVLVTKDEDFHRLSVLLGPPPKDDVACPLRRRRSEIVAFTEHPEVAFLALG